MILRRVLVVVLGVLAAGLWLAGGVGYAQAGLTPDQLKQLVAPFALFPDALVAQITAASTDPQQIHDVDLWMRRNSNLDPQALTDAAQQQGFDPAFVSLVNFPTVLDMMAENLDDYAALGQAFKADQQAVMAAIQTLRQDAFARGVLDTNEYQNVSLQQDGGVQVVVIQPANPQVVFVPVYQPQQVWSSGPSTGDVVAASMLSFGAGIAMGAWLNNSHPWGWGGWGWGWGGRGMVVHNNVWVVNNRWRSPHPTFRPRPPRWNRPIYARPPNNWNQRPGWRPPPSGWRPNGPNNPNWSGGNRPGGNRPGGGNAGGNRPGGGNAGGNRPGGGNTGGNRPGGGNTGNNRPGGGNSGNNRPGGNPGGNTGGNRPGGGNSGGNTGGNAGANRPGGNTPGGNTGASRPGGNAGANRPGGGNAGGNAGSNRPGGNTGANRPGGNTGNPPGGGNRPTTGGGANRPATGNRPPNNAANRPANNNRPAGGSNVGRPQSGQRPQQTTGSRPGGLGGNNSGNQARAASNRGRSSAGGGNQGGRRS